MGIGSPLRHTVRAASVVLLALAAFVAVEPARAELPLPAPAPSNATGPAAPVTATAAAIVDTVAAPAVPPAAPAVAATPIQEVQHTAPAVTELSVAVRSLPVAEASAPSVPTPTERAVTPPPAQHHVSPSRPAGRSTSTRPQPARAHATPSHRRRDRDLRAAAPPSRVSDTAARPSAPLFPSGAIAAGAVFGTTASGSGATPAVAVVSPFSLLAPRAPGGTWPPAEQLPQPLVTAAFERPG
jgi:hypothetical protein